MTDSRVDMMHMLHRQVMDADTVAERALADANTADGFQVAAFSRSIAFYLAQQVARLSAESAADALNYLRESAELELKKAEVAAKLAEARHAQEKHDREMIKLGWETHKLRAEAQKLSMEVGTDGA